MKSFGITLGLVAVLGSTFAFGYYGKDLAGSIPGVKPINTLLGVKTTSPSLAPEVAFRDQYTRILKSYPEKVDPTALKYAGMEGLVGALGDPHTNFFPPEINKAFREETEGNFFGVGARLGEDPLGARAVNVFPTGPAYAADLRDGDIITAVDGEKVAGMSTVDIVPKIKGPEGTTVALTVIRAGKEGPMILSIKRARIITPTVESKVLRDQGVGYISIAMFSEPTAEQFDEAIANVEKGNIKGLVIDVRGNPGGLLEIVSQMLGRFKGDEEVLKMKLRRDDNGQEVTQTQRTPNGVEHKFNYPIVVLMNSDSASAAEILSGCLRDYGVAKLVGEHSYGKASVQNLFPLPDGASAKITIAKYLLPKSGDIGRKVDDDGAYISGGLKPDVEVEPNYDNEFEFGNPEKDNQLKKAIEVVLGE